MVSLPKVTRKTTVVMTTTKKKRVRVDGIVLARR
jgi:hypothetical protein